MIASYSEHHALSHRYQPEAALSPEPPPLQVPLGWDLITKKPYNKSIAAVAEHEGHHIFVANEYAGIPYREMTLTALPSPDGQTLGMVTLPGYIDVSSFQVVSMASSVPDSRGKSEGTGSDVAKAWYMHHQHGGMHPETAKMRAEATLAGTEEVRAEAAKIIAYMQTELGWSVIPGHIYSLILRRAEWEINQQREVQRVADIVKPERILHEDKELPKDQQIVQGQKTDIIPLVGRPHEMQIVYRNDTDIIDVFIVCNICLQRDSHTDWCAVIQSDESHVGRWRRTVRDTIETNPQAVIEDLLQAGKRLADEIEESNVRATSEHPPAIIQGNIFPGINEEPTPGVPLNAKKPEMRTIFDRTKQGL